MENANLVYLGDFKGLRGSDGSDVPTSAELTHITTYYDYTEDLAREQATQYHVLEDQVKEKKKMKKFKEDSVMVGGDGIEWEGLGLFKKGMNATLDIVDCFFASLFGLNYKPTEKKEAERTI